MTHLVIPTALVLVLAGTGPDPLSAELRKAGVEPDRQGIEKFLESFRLTPEREARVRALLADLGSERFRTREKATADLLAMPHIPRALLQEAANKDLETSRRVERLLAKSLQAETEGKLHLALRVVEAQRITGLAPLLLELMPQWQETYLVQSAGRAVAASAVPADGKLLREAIAGARPTAVRTAAVAALVSVFAKKADRELEKLLADPDPWVSLAAATPLLNHGERAPLLALVGLLDAEPPEIRVAAFTLLRNVTGQQFDYSSFDEPKERAKAIAAWRAWAVGPGRTAALQLPVPIRPPWLGRAVLTVFQGAAVREIDLATGNTVLEVKGFQYPWGAHATPEGHRLVVDWVGSFVVEYDSRGKECWRQKVPGHPTSVERLPDGRTLLTLAEPGQVVEIDRTGKVVWEATLRGRPTTAQRMTNGNTLVNLQDLAKVVEIDRRGQVRWEVGGLKTPHTAEQLDNGNVLVCDMAGKVTEFDRSGKAVWSREGLNNPAQAQRLPNGNTLIAEAEAISEFDRQGNVVRRFPMPRARFFAY